MQPRANCRDERMRIAGGYIEKETGHERPFVKVSRFNQYHQCDHGVFWAISVCQGRGSRLYGFPAHVDYMVQAKERSAFRDSCSLHPPFQKPFSISLSFFSTTCFSIPYNNHYASFPFLQPITFYLLILLNSNIFNHSNSTHCSNLATIETWLMMAC